MQEHGVSINPTAFLVVQPNLVKLLPVKHTSTIDKILDYVPDIIEKANVAMDKCIENKKDLGEINTMKKRCEKHEKNENKEENQNDDSGDVEKKIEIKLEKEDEDEEKDENEQE